jgi:hypothetical protein
MYLFQSKIQLYWVKYFSYTQKNFKLYFLNKCTNNMSQLHHGTFYGTLKRHVHVKIQKVYIMHL